MNLVLLRHGQAEEIGTHLNDAERELTARGRERLRRGAEGLKVILRDCSSVQIWHSPLIRARQTAEITADVLNIKKVAAVEALATGDLIAFKEKIRQLSYGACLIAVGHEPYLGLWSQEICGARLLFGKGAAAGFKVGGADSLTGELDWFAQSQVLSDFARYIMK